MRRLVTGLAIAVAGLISLPASATQGCSEDWQMEAASFEGEIYGDNEFVADAGLHDFVLEPTGFGWRIAMRTKDGEGVAVFSPPIRPVDTNPTNIAGWHFRNLANDGPNRGEVNAPQRERTFVFGRMASDPALNPELVAPNGAPPNAATVEPVTGEYGGGELVIEDYGLADLEPGKRARMVYMKFHGCVAWNRGSYEHTLASSADPEIAKNVADAFAECGLDAALYKLSGRMARGREGGQRAWQEPDLDGDHLRDLAVPVTRMSDDAPGVAMCLRKDRRLVLAGFDGRIGKHLDPVYFGRSDYWHVHDQREVSQGVAEDAPPLLTGDALLFGKEGASSVLLYLDGDLLPASYWQGD